MAQPVTDTRPTSLLGNGELGLLLSALGVVHARTYLGLNEEMNGTTHSVTLVESSLNPEIEEPLVQEAILRRGASLIAELPQSPSNGSHSRRLSIVAAPVDVEDRTAGAVLLGFPDDSEVTAVFQRQSLTSLVAHLVGARLTCAQLQRSLAQQNAQLNGMVDSVVRAWEAEREWISMEMHDGPTQNMVSALQFLQACEGSPDATSEEVLQWVQRAGGQIREAIQQSQEMIDSVGAAPCSDRGFAATVLEELSELEEETGCRVEFHATSVPLLWEVELALYRIAHEAITNVRRHASSPRIRVSLTHKRGTLTLSMRDWGVGFELATVGRRGGRQATGLFSMRKRAELLGGILHIITRPGQGTQVVAILPYQAAEAPYQAAEAP